MGATTAAAGPRIWGREPTPPLPLSAPGEPHILYLNDCSSGCLVGPGASDARVNTSSIVGQVRLLSPYAGSRASWHALVACMKDIYAPFEVDIVTEDPGNVPHAEVMIAGTPAELGFASNLVGIAPGTCDPLASPITFAFANSHAPGDVAGLCWTAAQESAHGWGLEHSMNPRDAMTYLPDPPVKAFVDEEACIGTQGCCVPVTECSSCGRTTINSYQRLGAVLGFRSLPVIDITAPLDREVVPAGFTVVAEAGDPDGIAKVDLLIDTTVVATLTSPPWELMTSPELRLGIHTIVVRATDLFGNEGEAAISVARQDPRDDEPPPDDTGCGCRTGAGRGSWIVWLALAAAARRRRR
jgi:MYXO-CTERM domain-containing protein